MNIITFPGFNLVLKVKQVAFSILGIDIYWYAILIVTAITIGILIYKINDGMYGIKFTDITDLMIYIIPISIISARIYYVLFNLESYSKNLKNMFNIRNGGLAIYGGIIGAVITCVIFAKKRKINLLNLLDYLVISLPIGQAIGRWGNFINIEAYGISTNLPWRMGIIENLRYIEVHPTFLYESIVDIIIFIILIKLKNKNHYNGFLTYLYIVLYSFARFFIEGIRTDSLMLANIRISQAFSAVLFVAFLTILVYKKVKNMKKDRTVIK